MESQYKTRDNEYKLTITAGNITSTDPRFTIEDLGLGDNYETLDVYFRSVDGTVQKRQPSYRERAISNQTLPRLVFQIFEKQLEALPPEEKQNFPICRYRNNEWKGLFSSREKFVENYGATISYVKCVTTDGQEFFLHCWNAFSTVIFAQECLKRFGKSGDQFDLVYKMKNEPAESAKPNKENKFTRMVREARNVIFHGAPGTGKTFLAKEIAADLVSNVVRKFEELNEEELNRIGFVQFHPSFDYSDFVEGLRPTVDNKGTTGFELRDGIFKRFVDTARENYEEALKSPEDREKGNIIKKAISDFLSNIEFEKDTFQTKNGTNFNISEVKDKTIYINILKDIEFDEVKVDIDALQLLLEQKTQIINVKEIPPIFNRRFATQGDSYCFALYQLIYEKLPIDVKTQNKDKNTPTESKGPDNFVFIIDEINRGEISKIFGELFFSVDPGYRGKKGAISTQYSSMYSELKRKFYVPENVYIIGTMNDIDRSVDSFDFAMRRRFCFVELKANEQVEMLSGLGEKEEEAKRRMNNLNKVIAEAEDLGENYQIGAAYFLKLQERSPEELWNYYLKPLLQEYVRGKPDEKILMNEFKAAYDKKESDANEAAGD